MAQAGPATECRMNSLLMIAGAKYVDGGNATIMKACLTRPGPAVGINAEAGHTRNNQVEVAESRLAHSFRKIGQARTYANRACEQPAVVSMNRDLRNQPLVRPQVNGGARVMNHSGGKRKTRFFR